MEVILFTFARTMRMKPGNILCEIAGPDQAEGRASSVEPVLYPAGTRLEASEFERLLERAAEILSLRERMAA